MSLRSPLVAALLFSSAPLLAAGARAVAIAGMPTASLAFPDGASITVEVAATPPDRERGLMNQTKLHKDYGMLFVFPAEQFVEFWMKNTWVELDMIFIGADRRITEVFRKVPRSFPATPDDKLARRAGRAQYVLELPSGAAARRRLKKGQRLEFSVMIPSI